ncbi:MAG: DUF4129 domain-containing protein [Jatrophihabitantaceae bacterium]
MRQLPLGVLTSAAPVGGSDAQHAAQQELSHDEYHRGGPGIVQRVLAWFGRQLDALLAQSSGASHATLLLLVLLLVLVVFAVAKVGLPNRAARDAAALGTDPLRPLGATDHRRRAEQFEAQGRRAEAVREWLRAAVQTIEDRGVLAPRPGRTGARTAHEAGPLLPAAAAQLRTATAGFDEIWFGGRPATNSDVAAAHSAADAVRSARISHRVVAARGYAVPT